jgi:pyruvate dehydrogenase E2 component (dihydrolipoamide acetyltransferase)
MPKLSPTMEEGQLTRWLKKEGDKVSMGEPLAEIDTDKATMEMQALSNGVLRKILIQEGESAPLGQPIAVIGEPDEDISDLLGSFETKDSSPKATAEAAGAAEATPEETAPEPSEPKTPQVVETPQVETPQVESKPTTAPSASSDRQPAPSPAADGHRRLLVSPIAARMAAEGGINLSSLPGSGPAGRIIKRDIEEALSRKETTAPGLPRPLKTRPLQKGEVYGPSPFRDEPLSEMRRTIARRLVTSLGPVPHFFLTTEIEMDRAADMRRSFKEIYPESKISVNDLIIKAAAGTLIQHPQVNASFQDQTVRYYERADIAVAVATENGLITPIVRSADLKSLSEIAIEVRELAERARARKLKPEEYTGASFSVSNLGMFGIDEFTGVINPPEGAILAIGAAAPKAVVREGQIVARQIMRVTMSCDHRVIDGAVGAQFLQTFKQILENPLYLVV